MDLYMVGGAVRDLVLGREPKDRDFVVVGASVAEFYSRFPNATPVGKAFQVWLVPGLGEVAFARRERKTDLGHAGFDVDCDPTVTLEEDLARRDLTINAMAIPISLDARLIRESSLHFCLSDLIDPHGGLGDIEDRLLRHVSNAFSEDPLRVYRLARFAATLPVDKVLREWRISPDTAELCVHIPTEEIASVSKDRVREEFLRAMRGPRPRRFVETLLDVGHLPVHFPELAALKKVPAGPLEWHPEGDALVHTLLALDAAVALDASEMERVCVLFHDLGKGTTPVEVLPHHYEHERRGVALVEALADRISLPREHREAAKLASDAHLQCHNFTKMRGVKMYDLVHRCERNPLGAEGLAMVAECDARGRPPAEPKLEGPEALRVAAGVYRIKLQAPPHLKGEAIGQYLRRAKGSVIKVAVDMLASPRAIVKKDAGRMLEDAFLEDAGPMDLDARFGQLASAHEAIRAPAPDDALARARERRRPDWMTSGRHG